MGTRSLTVFQNVYMHEGNQINEEIAVLYRQFDGYPSGHGADLKAFLDGFKLTNGFGGDTTKLANGMSCLAAQVIAHLKTDCGNFYLYPAGTRDCGEEYIYVLQNKDNRIFLTIKSGSMTFFGMSGDDEKEMDILYEGFIDDFDPDKIDGDE